MTQPQIFISHASADKKLIDALRDLMVVGMGVQQERLFCTSLEGTGIPEGQSFVQFIKSKIQTPPIVVMVVTPSYYESAFCLCELGAAWAMSHNSFPLIVPPVTFADLQGVLSGSQVGKITDEAVLDRLLDRVRAALQLQPGSTATWTVKRDQFLEKLSRSLLKSIAGFKKVDSKKHEAALQSYKEASEQLAAASERIEELEQQLSDISKLKDKKEVSKIRKRGQKESETFEELAENARKRLSPLPNVAVEAAFYHFSGGRLRWPGFGEDEKRDEIRRAIDDKYLIEGENDFPLNEGDPTVAKALKAVRDLENFLANASEDFETWFTEEYELQPRLDSRRFWREKLGLL